MWNVLIEGTLFQHWVTPLRYLKMRASEIFQVFPFSFLLFPFCFLFFLFFLFVFLSSFLSFSFLFLCSCIDFHIRLFQSGGSVVGKGALWIFNYLGTWNESYYMYWCRMINFEHRWRLFEKYWFRNGCNNNGIYIEVCLGAAQKKFTHV